MSDHGFPQPLRPQPWGASNTMAVAIVALGLDIISRATLRAMLPAGQTRKPAPRTRPGGAVIRGVSGLTEGAKRQIELGMVTDFTSRRQKSVNRTSQKFQNAPLRTPQLALPPGRPACRLFSSYVRRHPDMTQQPDSIIDISESALRLAATKVHVIRPDVETHTALAVIQSLLVLGWRPAPGPVTTRRAKEELAEGLRTGSDRLRARLSADTTEVP